jgi:hypothetical protein
MEWALKQCCCARSNHAPDGIYSGVKEESDKDVLLKQKFDWCDNARKRDFLEGPGTSIEKGIGWLLIVINKEAIDLISDGCYRCLRYCVKFRATGAG